MKVLRLYFDNDDPLDVQSEDVRDVSASTVADKHIAVTVDAPNLVRETDTILARRADFIERSSDSNVDLK